MLQNTSQSGDSIVTSMVVLGQLTLLGLGRVIKWELDCSLNSQEAPFTHSGECCASMLGSHTNTIDCSLPNSSILGLGMATNLLDYLRIDWS